MKLSSWQKEAIRDLHGLFKVNRAVCLAWYTGAGKTNIISQFCKETLEKNSSVKIGIWSYLTTEIRDQVSERLTEFGLKDEHSVISRASKDVSKPILVFNPQSVSRTKLKVKLDLFIIDEGHAGVNERCKMIQFIKTNYCTKKTKILIVSATPWDTLAMKEYKGIPVLKRSLEQGLNDGFIADVRVFPEEANVEFSVKDFNRSGDIAQGALTGKLPIVKSACEAKMEYLIRKYKHKLGRKVLVICPPGNFGEIARHLASKFNGLAFLQDSKSFSTLTRAAGLGLSVADTHLNLAKFKSDDTRFLFVIQKCGVGFDMKDLDSVIDLTMTRNILTLVQRIGRVARKDGEKKKSYFYVYDKSLLKDRLEWLLTTVVDFSLGAYDGWTTRTVKYRTVLSGGLKQKAYPYSVTIKEIINAIKAPGAIETKRVLKCVDYVKPQVWNLELAKREALKYQDRTDMWEKRPALYKWFRLNAKSEMDKIFPFKHRLGKWHMDSVLEVMKKNSGKMTRHQFRDKFGGVEYFLYKLSLEERNALLDKYFPLSNISAPKWNETEAKNVLKDIKTWSDVRKHGGLRKWMQRNGGEKSWQLTWIKLHNNKVSLQRTGRRKKSA